MNYRTLKAFHCDDMDIYAAYDEDQARQLWTDMVGSEEVMDDGYPRELTDAELDQPQPEFDENEQRTGEWTSVREFLGDTTEPGWLCGSGG